jgi:hypothetical protein
MEGLRSDKLYRFVRLWGANYIAPLLFGMINRIEYKTNDC